ncbi:hypothetical protein CTM97_18540 [Photobacterium phosphoreum]|uniref:Apea-like HEPN domain-containing protein n=1 Tax=Photobacterium phosphoreum TaxID=659 RepID=A0A2T3JBP9_PHOPO|nr:hypothetical protein [Photobacterium phosphoreum]PSU19937.1 hypothetical protein CTM96_20520 [Photobacterium phosphoreum]PSU38786.1 hypothetical protein CTM97_18540 [Photobacterium phosphoreum]PSU46291.1 hypothetical protein C9J18_20710 [Photobacterium phosphoreum]
MNFNSLEQLKYLEIEFLAFVPFDIQDSFTNDELAYEVYGVYGKVKIQFERVYDPVPQHFPLGIAKGAKIEVDRYGQLSRSVVRVQVPRTTLVKLDVSQKDWENRSKQSEIEDKALTYSLGLFNKFTEKYAEVTGDFWVTSPRKNDVLSHQIKYEFNIGTGGKSQKMMPIPVNFSGGVGHFVSEDQDEMLRKKLRSDETDAVTSLLLSAKDFDHKEQFGLAIVQCAIAFEFFVYNEAISFKSNTKKKNFIKEHTKKSECGCHIGINAFCNTGLSEHLGINFSDTVEFQNVTNNVTSVRNKIVHGEVVKLSAEKSTQAISSTQSAINYLRKVITE